MIKADEDCLICDLAETYHIFNYRELSVKTIATLSIGLRDDSRIKMKLSGQKLNLNKSLQALIVDDLNFLVWAKTKDAQKNKNKPKSIFKALTSTATQDLFGFDSVDDFMSERKRLMERSRNG